MSFIFLSLTETATGQIAPNLINKHKVGIDVQRLDALQAEYKEHRKFREGKFKLLSEEGKKKEEEYKKKHDGYFTIKKLKSELDEVPYYDTAELRTLRTIIQLRKDSTTAEFLTADKRPITYGIWKINQFDIDTFNNYLYNQNKIDAFQNVSLQTALDPGTFVNAEFGSFLFGPVRMGVNASFKTKGDTSLDNAIKTSIEKIVANGGMINLNFTLPLLYVRNRLEQVHFGIFAQSVNGFNPNIDTSVNKGVRTDFSSDLLYSNQSGLLAYFDVASNNQTAKISLQLSADYVWGSRSLYQTLSLPDFFVTRLQVGVTISNLMTFQIAGPFWSSCSAVQKVPFTMTLQFSPSQAIKAQNSGQ